MTWRLAAESLLRAARALPPLMDENHRARLDPEREELKHPVGAVYMMLAGMAVENLVKALVVEKDPAAATSDGKLSKALKNHGLLELLAAADVDLTEDELQTVPLSSDT